MMARRRIKAVLYALIRPLLLDTREVAPGERFECDGCREPLLWPDQYCSRLCEPLRSENEPPTTRREP